MTATTKDQTKWSLSAWLRRVFRRSSTEALPGTAATITDPSSPRSNLTKAEKRMIMRATRGYWYACRQNHPYLVGNCGLPMEYAVCPTCGDAIGGSGYTHNNAISIARGSQRIKGIF